MFQAIKSSEHMLSHGVFLLIQVYMFINFLKSNLSEDLFKKLYHVILYGVVVVFVMAFLVLSFTGHVYFGARSLTLLDPSYARKFIPIVASVSEHQPTTWSSFFFDLHYMLVFAPLGFYYCYKKPTNSRLFIAVFGVCSVYFSCVMVRLLLLSSPALCLLSGLGLSDLMNYVIKQYKNFNEEYDAMGNLVMIEQAPQEEQQTHKKKPEVTLI